MYQIVFYRNKRGDYPVKEFIDSLEIKTQAKVYKFLEILQQEGPNLPRPYADILRGKIRELRISHGRLEIRILYCFCKNKIILLTNGFLKKARKTDSTEIDAAISRMNEYIAR